MFRMLEEIHKKFKQDIEQEERERQHKMGSLLQMLEESCQSIQKNLKIWEIGDCDYLY